MDKAKEKRADRSLALEILRRKLKPRELSWYLT